ncbi:MAG: F0F1 ATP synthase subunit B [Candidatus Jettenia sp.]|uniref:ATP synthase subunit b n=1 Tax=Candidatus Jettenia caeni TaxID=247490 RepID=I3ILM7_9BACT|nr:F0F1 ATP synthase B subunit [Candidatus Jettenia sp. AMX1]MBC6927354.1 F0F1 ATP synthase subunit B [Candidatus Jettenia sp.]NUN24266.1 F0F1 ATP synthase subunit B [Candidatus Jettenia caeni]KAA0251731.1 MAG: F0F1 ATP synthase subunit B [Candidatus Jettenia sp. AMX1]MCE7879037.1 F0F1 ATP synthase subunit B [Candidatus Jettenia sp. AMX1]MCQ3925783.1 F0F1 ATP synthase subunit B [Candidatus Jettenia sp.]
MQIDVLTLIAQIINFVILVVLLKYFLYNRIVKVMDERKEKIISQLKDADQKKQEAEQEAESYRKKLKELDDKYEEMLSKAHEEVESQRKELLKKAHGEIREAQVKWYEAIQHERQLFMNDIRQQAGKEVCAVARRALADLADADLGRQIIDFFIKKIQRLDKQERDTLRRSIQGSKKYEIDINSAFEIPQEMRQKMIHEIQKQITSNSNVRFTTSPNLICGIELKVDGHKISWNLENYLRDLEDNVTNAIERKVRENQENMYQEKQNGKRQEKE